MLAIFKMINKYFWRSWAGPISLFFIPLIFAGIYVAFGLETYVENFPSFVVSGLSAINLIALPSLIVDLRRSLILKRIGSAKIKKDLFILLVFIIFFLLSLIVIIYSFLIYAIAGLFLTNDMNVLFGNKDILTTFYALIQVFIVAFFFGITIGFFAKNPISASIIGFALIFFSLLTSGLFIPLPQLRENDAMRYISYIVPLDAPILMAKGAWGSYSKTLEGLNIITTYLNTNMWDINTNFVVSSFGGDEGIKEIIIFNQVDKIISIISPFLITPILYTSTKFKFTWTER